MFHRILLRLREEVRGGRYVVTLHADEEMFNDGLTVLDLETAIMTGQIEERQRTGIPGQWKYRVRGLSASGDTMEVILKAAPAGIVIITAYLI